ncbi:MAG: TonB-dependent receptor plug domain-containing protein [bacterium JZ-2024 1]
MRKWRKIAILFPLAGLPGMNGTEECLLPYRLVEAPAYVEVLCGEELRKGEFTFLTDVLGMIPGIYVVRPSASQAFLGIRGVHPFSSTKSLLLVDEREPFLNFFGVTQWTLLPVDIEDVDRVEITRAPGTIYGGNALTGVIQIFTKDVQEEAKYSWRVKAGEGEWYQASIRWKNEWKKLSGKWGISGVRMEDGPPRADMLSARDTLLWGKAIYPASAGQEFAFSFYQSRRKSHSFVPLAVSTLPTSTFLQSYTLSYRFSRSPRQFVKSTFSWESSKLSVPSTQQVPFVRGNIGKSSWDISGYRPLGKTGFFSYGFSLRWWKTGTGPSVEDPEHPTGFSERSLFTKEISEVTYGGYIQGKVPTGETSTVFLGGRWDGHYSAGSRFAPFFSWVWQPSLTSTGRFSFYRAYRAPDIFELFSDFLLLDKNVALIFRGNPELSFERNDGVEISWESSSARFRWVAQGYAEKLHRPIGRKFLFNPDRGVNELVFSHLSDVRYAGVDFSGTYYAPTYLFFSRFSWNQPLNEVNEIPFPHWSFTVGVATQYEKRASFSLYFQRAGKTRWETGKRESVLQQIRPVSLLNFSSLFPLSPFLKVRVKIWNALNKKFMDFFTYEQERRILFQLEWQK